MGGTVALSVDNGVAKAVLARKLTGKGDVTMTASVASDAMLNAVASTKGVTQGSSGVAGSTADDQTAQQTGFATALGRVTGATPFGQSLGGRFGSAASLALSVIGGSALARVTSSGALQSQRPR